MKVSRWGKNTEAVPCTHLHISSTTEKRKYQDLACCSLGMCYTKAYIGDLVIITFSCLCCYIIICQRKRWNKAGWDEKHLHVPFSLKVSPPTLSPVLYNSPLLQTVKFISINYNQILVRLSCHFCRMMRPLCTKKIKENCVMIMCAGY